MQSISNSIPQSYIKVSFNNSPRTTVTNTQNVQLIKRKSLSTHLIKGKEEQTSIRTKQTDTGKETARGRISPIHRARLDPLHLPRAPTLRHNVSLCHGRLFSLLSLERFNSAGSHSSLTHTENLVCGILDFGNSSNWMARSWMQLVQQRFARKTSEIDASIGGGRETRSGSRAQFFSIHPFSPSLSTIFFLFFFSFSYNIGRCCCKMQPRMSCENIDALWAATVYSGPRLAVLQGIIDTGFLSMGSRETSMDRRFLWNLLTWLA